MDDENLKAIEVQESKQNEFCDKKEVCCHPNPLKIMTAKSDLIKVGHF